MQGSPLFESSGYVPAIRATKYALKTFSEAVGDVEGLTDKEMLDKRLAKFLWFYFSVAYFSV